MRDQDSRMTRRDGGLSSPLNLDGVTKLRTERPRATEAAGPSAPQSGWGTPGRQKEYSHREVARKLKQDYALGGRDPGIRHLDSLHSLVKYLVQTNPKLDEMLRETARLIYNQFSIKEVSIAIRSNSNGLYRYVAQHGMRANVWAAHSKITYTAADLKDTSKYRPFVVSHSTNLYLAEDNPYGPEEMDTFSEHMMKQSVRKSDTDSIEGDYIDIFFYGPRDEVLGWIELSSTWDNKIPDAATIRYLELVASILGIAVLKHEATG